MGHPRAHSVCVELRHHIWLRLCLSNYKCLGTLAFQLLTPLCFCCVLYCHDVLINTTGVLLLVLLRLLHSATRPCVGSP